MEALPVPVTVMKKCPPPPRSVSASAPRSKGWVKVSTESKHENGDNHLKCEAFVQEVLRENAIIGMVDMDAFEVQIYLQQLFGRETGFAMYRTTPTILADPTTDRIISVNFLAKATGISREDRVPEAMEKCPELDVIRKKFRFYKPENRSLRHSSWRVLDTIYKFRSEMKTSMTIEYASNDEFYLDLTDEVDRRMSELEQYNPCLELNNDTYLELEDETLKICKGGDVDLKTTLMQGADPEISRLICGAGVIHDLKKFLFDATGFECSGGVGRNKLFAKLACPMHKPAGVTILTERSFARVTTEIPIHKLPGLGGERGRKLKAKLFPEDEDNFKETLTIRELALLPISKMLGIQSDDLTLKELRECKKMAIGIFDDCVMEKRMKCTASVSRANLHSLKFFMTERINEAFKGLADELGERLGEEKQRHCRIPEAILVEISFILFPRKEEDRGKPPTVEKFMYSDGEIVDGDFGSQVSKDFLEIVKGLEGIITKIVLVVKTFIAVDQ